VAIGLQSGFDSSLFAVSIAFTIITLFDAQGVRRWSGRQAQVLNKMMEDIYFKRRIQEKRLKELLGHSPIEVLAGVGVGIATALALN
jgi:acid phosphatase family membrane protein YuiD